MFPSMIIVFKFYFDYQDPIYCLFFLITNILYPKIFYSTINLYIFILYIIKFYY